MNGYYTISEMASLFNISSHTLRYYDKVGLLKPGGLSEGSQYRLYGQEEINRLYLIRELKETGLSLTNIKEYCNSKDVYFLEKLLKENRDLQEEKIQRLLSEKRNADFYLETIKRTRRVYQENIFEIKELKDRCFYHIQLNFTLDNLREIIELLHNSYSSTYSKKLPRDHGHVVLEIDQENLQKKQYKMYNGIGLLFEKMHSDKNTRCIGGGKYAVTSHIGSYETIFKTYGKLCRYIEKKGYQISGSSVEISVINLTITNNPDEYVTEIQIPVKSAE